MTIQSIIKIIIKKKSALSPVVVVIGVVHAGLVLIITGPFTGWKVFKMKNNCINTGHASKYTNKNTHKNGLFCLNT